MAEVPQTEALDSRQVLNNAGGFVYTIDDFSRLKRFLILGAEDGGYYVKKSKLKFENAQAILRLLTGGRGQEVVKEIVTISTEGRAPKQSPGIFALALCARLGDDATRHAAFDAVRAVCRTASTLFEFIQACKELGAVAAARSGSEQPEAKVSWGRGMRRAVAQWYLGQTPSALAYQVTKYRCRNGWTHTDLLRLAHPDVAAAGRKRRREAAAAVEAGEALATLAVSEQPATTAAPMVSVDSGSASAGATTPELPPPPPPAAAAEGDEDAPGAVASLVPSAGGVTTSAILTELGTCALASILVTQDAHLRPLAGDLVSKAWIPVRTV